MILYQQESVWRLLNPASVAVQLWRQRGLLKQLTQRNVELRHKGSHLGIVWSLVSPLLTFGVYVFVFVGVFEGRFGSGPKETAMDFALGVFVGLSVIQFAVETLSLAPQVIVTNPNLVKKVVFPLEVLPVAVVSAAFFHCVIAFGLVLLATAFFGPGLTWAVLWLPVILMPTFLLGLGIAWLLAAVGVFLRDMVQIVQLFSLLLTFMSATFYPASKIPVALSFLKWNPLLITVEMARDVLLWHRPVSVGALGYLFLVGLAGCAVGHAFFCRMKPAFADVL